MRPCALLDFLFYVDHVAKSMMLMPLFIEANLEQYFPSCCSFCELQNRVWKTPPHSCAPAHTHSMWLYARQHRIVYVLSIASRKRGEFSDSWKILASSLTYYYTQLADRRNREKKREPIGVWCCCCCCCCCCANQPTYPSINRKTGGKHDGEKIRLLIRRYAITEPELQEPVACMLYKAHKSVTTAPGRWVRLTQNWVKFY